MKKHIFLVSFFFLGTISTSFCAVVAPSPELLGLRDEIIRQRGVADAYVARQQDELFVETCHIPAEIQAGLNRFFSDLRVRRLFVDRYKECVVSWPVRNRMARDGGMRKQLLDAHEASYMRESGKVRLPAGEFDAIFPALIRDYGLVNLEEDGNNFALTSPTWPGFIVKIAKYRWVDNDAMLAFPYQLMSRVFYNRELNDFIMRNGLERYIVRFPKRLFHIPGTPEKIDDDNYVVVEPLLPCPIKQENIRRFRAMVEQDGEQFVVKEEFAETLAALVGVVQHCGLWCISPSNVFVMDDGKIAFVDTERPGLGGSEWRFFFHQGEGAAAEVSRNAQGGIDGLFQDILGTAPKPH